MEKGVIGREGVNEGARREWGMEEMGERNQNGLWQEGSKKDRMKCGWMIVRDQGKDMQRWRVVRGKEASKKECISESDNEKRLRREWWKRKRKEAFHRGCTEEKEGENHLFPDCSLPQPPLEGELRLSSWFSLPALIWMIKWSLHEIMLLEVASSVWFRQESWEREEI